MYPLAIAEKTEPIGPELPMRMLDEDLLFTSSGVLALREKSSIADFSRRHPRTWFLVQSEGRQLSFGPVPKEARGRIAELARTTYLVRYRDFGAPGPAGDALAEQIEVQGRKAIALTGGVVSTAIGFADYLSYTWRLYFFWAPVFAALLNLVGGLIAIPIVLRSVRSTARSAAELDPSDVSKRLPDNGVVKELLPIVQAFNAALERLADGFERRRRFIADVAHELRTPLAVLNMHVDAMPEGGKKPDLQRTVFRLGQMIGQMLDAERLTLGDRRHQQINLVELARGAVAEVAPLAVASGYEVAFSAGTEEVLVRGDARSISRAVINLLGNAVAHGGGAGTIEVKVAADRAVDVSDQGEGGPGKPGSGSSSPSIGNAGTRTVAAWGCISSVRSCRPMAARPAW
jgi:signal transduction histidine kinase